MAATFLCIAEKKIKKGGRIGFVLPRSVAFMDSWQDTRKMIEEKFEDIMIVAIESGKATGGDAISADTNIEEVFLIAQKKKDENKQNMKHVKIRCVTLYEPIKRIGEAAEIAKAVNINRNETIIKIGKEEIGIVHIFKAKNGEQWASVGVRHDTLQKIMNGIIKGKIIDKNGITIKEISMTTIKELFGDGFGPTNHLIGRFANSKFPCGAFVIHKVTSKVDAKGEYRSLWKVDSQHQTKMIVIPTHKGIIREQENYERIWNTRSNLFYTMSMNWGSAKLISAMTKDEAMGGTGWVSLYHKDIRIMKAFCLWANSIYGMVTCWAEGGRTQHGRSRFGIESMKKIPCPKFNKMNDEILDYAEKEFDKLADEELNAANQAEHDKTRDKINNVVSEILEIFNYDTNAITKMWCSEASVKSKERAMLKSFIFSNVSFIC